MLASRSPQRREILDRLGIAFTACPADVVEVHVGDPAAVAGGNAARKARAAAARTDVAADAIVLGVDTVVARGGTIHPKPVDEAAARATLRALSGAGHTVLGGMCVIRDGVEHLAVARTEVTFRALEDSELDWYLESGEWRGRAGGYAIQGRGAALVAGIHGDYCNVVGLSVALLQDMLGDLLVGRR